MKNSSVFFLLVFWCAFPNLSGHAQDFQRMYGTGLDNSFSKVIKDGSNYYVLGLNESSEGAPRFGTITRLDANGQHQWTLEPDFACVWHDAIRIPNGDLLVVGSTLPFDATSNSLIGLVTPAGGGNFSWLRSYNEPGTIRNAFTKIVQNPLPENPLFPYYIVGTQSEIVNQANSDVVLLNINSNGNVNWKKKFESTNDDKFYNDLEVLPDGGLLLAGSHPSDVIFKVDHSGDMVNGVQSGTSQLSIKDLALSGSGEIYAVGSTNTGVVHLMLFDENLGLQWDATLPELTSISQVWERSFGELFLIGRGTYGGNSRGAIIKFDEPSASVDWVQYLSAGNSISGESASPMPNGQIAYTDGRILPGGFGQQDAFISLSDFQLNTCQVDAGSNFGLFTQFPLPSGPVLPATFFQDIPSPTEHVIFQALNWEQAEVCNTVPCTVDFTYQVDCGAVTFHGQSGFPNPASWQWSFAGGSPSNSASQDPIVNFLECGSYKVCLVVTGGDPQTSCSVCHTITISDNIPPVALCLGIGVILDANCQAFITPQQIDGGSSDDCLIQSMSVSPAVLTGCGLFPVSLTVTDWCGNRSTCTTMVQTIEDTPPTITCPSGVTLTSSSPSPCSSVVNNIAPSNVSDNCSTPTVTFTITGATTGSGINNASGSVFNEGVSTITYTATDDCGNTTTCSLNVTINCSSAGNEKCGWTVATCYAGNPGDPVAVIYDTRFNSQAIPGADWGNGTPPVPAIHPVGWKRDSIGNVFGIALDNNNKIFLAASDIYRYDNPSLSPAYGYGGAAGVYMTVGNPSFPTTAIVGTLNSPTLFPITGTSLPNTASAGGNGIGNIAYDQVHNQLFLTNLEDGRIYRITTGGNILSAYDPFQLDNGQAGLAGILGERLWGIGVYNSRVYFARENLLTNKQIWSIPIDPVTGEFIANTTGGNLYTGTAQLEINNGPGSQKKYTDIAFSQTGKMLLAERGNPHDAGIYEFQFSGSWIPSGKVFSVGGNTSGKNSAGGVDYGYREQNGNPKTNCDGLIWASGNCMDPALVSGSWCKVYGLEAFNSGGNVFPGNSSSDIYIDFDGQYTSTPKYQIGDVEVFKCGCTQPTVCDSIWVTSVPFNGPQDTCCFKLTIHNLKPNYISEIQLFTNNGVSFSNVSALNGWCFPNYYSQSELLFPPGCAGLIPVVTQDFVTFCLSNYQNVPNQQVYVRYFDQYFIQVCDQTLNYECTQAPRCMEVTNTVECAPDGKYLMNFCIKSNSFIGFDVSSFVLNPPAGITFTPNVFTPNPSPLMPGQTQCNFTTTVSGAVTDGQNICYSVTAYKGDITTVPPPNDPSPGCSDTVMLACATMPSCICNSLTEDITSISSPGDTCCWEITLHNNYSTNFFTGVQLDILTPGVVFGAIQNQGNWNLVSSATQATFILLPPGSFLGSSEILPSFCLSAINNALQVPQLVVIKWLTNGNRVVCTDTLEFNCPPPVNNDCALLIEPLIECEPGNSGFYNFSFQIQNNSGFTVSQVVLNSVTPPAIFPNQFTLSPPLPNGQTYATSLSTQVTGLQPGQQVCFYLSMNDGVPGGTALHHCTNFQQYCFTMPACSDSCCVDSVEFDALVNQGFTVINDGCSVTVTAPQFDSCYWFGTPPYVVGGFPVPDVITDPGGSWTFSFSNSGTYQICVNVFDGCQGKQMCTNVHVNCNDGCHCGIFSDMVIRFERGPGEPLTCGGPPVLLNCPPAGYSYTITGKFTCQGSGCPSNSPFDWELKGPDGGTIASGSDFANAFFGISLPNSYLQQGGIYTLTLIGHCGSQLCPCVIKFLVDSPCLIACPCEPDDIAEFTARVEKGFAQIVNNESCEVCFSPIALNDCETVEWHLNSIDEPAIGTSAGRSSFCYSFGSPGDYNVIMNVTKKKDDGSKCDKQQRMEAPAHVCLLTSDCHSEYFDNASFGEGAVKGGLNTGGHSNNWKASSGNPKLNEGQFESFDGWTMQLSGNLDTADILTQIEPICLAKIEGMITVRIAVNDSAPGGIFFAKAAKEKPKESMRLAFSRSDVILNECDGPDCYPLATIPFSGLDTGTWLDVFIPYNLSDWITLDSCGQFPSVSVRPYIYVTNALSNNQGGAETFTYVQLDNLCINGTIVAIEEPQRNKGIQIYPNPTTGELIVKFLRSTAKPGVIEVYDLYGRRMFSQLITPGKGTQSLSISALPAGVYSVRIMEKGMPVQIEKIIKQ